MNVLALICVLLIASCVHCIPSGEYAGSGTLLNDDISTAQMADQTEVASLGRAVQIGELYDARTDQFIRLLLFNDTLPEDTIKSRDNFNTKSNYDITNKLDEKFNMMDISASLKVSVMSGLFTLEGSGKFFKDTKKSAKSAKATLMHSITTKAERVNMYSSAIDQVIDRRALNDIDCTHVVVGIQWGGNAFISVEDSNQEDKDTQIIEGSLKAHMDKWIKIDGAASVNFSEGERKEFSKFSFEIFGDVLPDEVPQDLATALTFMANVPDYIKKANDGRGMAIAYTLLPISGLRKRFGGESKLNSLIKDVNNVIVKKATNLFDDLNTARAELNDVMNRIKRFEPYIASDRVKAMNDISFDFNIIQSEAQKQLAQHLIAVRSGAEESHELESILSNYTQKLKDMINNKTNKFYNLQPALEFVEFLAERNVTLLKKTQMFRQFLRDHFNQDIYVLFYNSDSSNASEEVKTTFQELLRNHTLWNPLFVGASYELLNETKFPVEIDPENKTRIHLYRDNTLLSANYMPGQSIMNETQPEVWSLYQIQQILNATKTQSNNLDNNHGLLKNKTERLEQNQMKLKTIPIGFIYIQLPFQKAPKELWTGCRFEDVTKQYGGKFFRAEGNGSEPFGNVQFENSPRLTNVKFMDVEDAGNWQTKITPGQWSAAVTSGNRDGRWVSMKFLVRDAEVRPTNYAVRIFKNLGCD